MPFNSLGEPSLQRPVTAPKAKSRREPATAGYGGYQILTAYPVRGQRGTSSAGSLVCWYRPAWP
jgi:hypothetical protein